LITSNPRVCRTPERFALIINQVERKRKEEKGRFS
jgi:hypothetical protein